MWKALEAALAGLERAFLFAANGLLLGMLAINIANILSRLFFDKGIIWVFPWTGVLFVWCIFLGFFVIYRRGQDIVIDVVTRRMASRLRAATELMVILAILGLMGVVIAQALVLVPRQVGVIDLVGIQRYWLSIPFFVSCALIVLHFIVRMRQVILELRDPKPVTDP